MLSKFKELSFHNKLLALLTATLIVTMLMNAVANMCLHLVYAIEALLMVISG